MTLSKREVKEMKIHLILFVTSVTEQQSKNIQKLLMKTIESDFRPMKGDIIDDPGFDSQFHNGYEVVKVTINYAKSECYVSLHPLVLELEDLGTEAYVEKLQAHGWRAVSKEEVAQ